jgi:hypothetical protein
VQHKDVLEEGDDILKTLKMKSMQAAIVAGLGALGVPQSTWHLPPPQYFLRQLFLSHRYGNQKKRGIRGGPFAHLKNQRVHKHSGRGR